MPYGVYTCPASLPEVPPAGDCRAFLAKIAKIVIQRDQPANYFDGTASPSTAIDLASSWAGLADSGDDTHITITPELEDVVFTDQPDIDSGENLDGAPIAVANGTTLVTAMVRSASPAEQAALELLSQEKKIWAYFFDANGRILCRLVAATIHSGFPISIYTTRVKDPSRAGSKADQFMTPISFHLKSGWYGTAAIVEPEAGFDPLTLEAT